MPKICTLNVRILMSLSSLLYFKYDLSHLFLHGYFYLISLMTFILIYGASQVAQW